MGDFVAIYGNTKDLWYGKVVECPKYGSNIDEFSTFKVHWLSQHKSKKLEYNLLKNKADPIEIGSLLGVVKFSTLVNFT